MLLHILSVMILECLLLCLCLYFLKRLVLPKRWYSRLPPEPPGNYPLIGHLYMFKDDPIEVLMQLGQELGGIFMFGFGPTTACFITDHQLVEQAMKEDSIPSRPLKEMPSQVLIRGKRTPDGSLPGIAFSDGQIWRDQRKFAFQQLITLGFGKTETIEEIIRGECDDIVSRMTGLSKKGQIELDSNFFIGNALNVVWYFMVGGRKKLSEKLLLTAKDFMRTQAPTPMGVLLLYFPFLLKLVAKLGLPNVLTARQEVDKILDQEIKEHEASFDAHVTRDFIDAYLHKIRETTDPKSSFYGELGHLNMRNSMFDLFIAGMDTTATTLSWALIYMMKWPGVQCQVQREIDREIGDATPSLRHRSVTPFTEATLLEIQRFACVVPWGPRATLEDVRIGNFDVPKNTHVLYIIRAMTQNPDLFPNPKQFDPTRFLSPDGSTFVKNDNVATFGLGKRKCPGENMAKLELYLFFVTLMRHFSFEALGDIDIKGDVGNVVEPKPIRCRVTLRR